MLARNFRLDHALLVVLLPTEVCGAAVKQWPASTFFTSSPAWTYLPRNLCPAFPQYLRPGLFESNPYDPEINGSLWTLLYEAVVRSGRLAALLGLLRRPLAFAAFLVAVCLAYSWSLAADPVDSLVSRLDQLASLSFPFALGSRSAPGW